MGINLGDAGEQKEIASGPIPKGSMVKVKLEIRQPKNPDPQDPCITVFKSGLKGLDCEFTVVSGQFENIRIWENLFLPPQMQTIQLTKGQEGVCNGGFAKCRAIIEAARRLDPQDWNANRNINSWYDLNGLEFPVKVGVDKPKPGDIYIKNSISKVLTVADQEFENVMGGGEVITTTPFPDIPESAETKKPPAQGQTQWGQGQQAQAPPAGQQPNQEQAPAQQVATPPWAQGAAQ